MQRFEEEKEEFVTFQSFQNKDQAIELMDILKENGISYVIDDFVTTFNPLFSSDSEINKEYHVQITQSNFQRVEKLLLELGRDNFSDTIDPDYYLLDFTDQELIDILIKNNEWSRYDYLLAIKLLNDRGVNVDLDQINNRKRERLDQMAEPEKNQTLWIYIGYVFALTGGIIGGLIGSLVAPVVGLHMFTSKKTLPNGKRLFTYSRSNRIHGLIIFILGIVVFILVIFFRIIGKTLI